jgi:hypothetical protein
MDETDIEAKVRETVKAQLAEEKRGNYAECPMCGNLIHKKNRRCCGMVYDAKSGEWSEVEKEEVGNERQDNESTGRGPW